MIPPKVNSNKQPIICKSKPLQKTSNIQKSTIWKFNDIDGLGIVDVENDFNNNQIIRNILEVKNWLGKKWDEVGNQINELLANVNIEDDNALNNLLKQANESNSTNKKSKSSEDLLKEYMKFIETKGYKKEYMTKNLDKILKLIPYFPDIAAKVDNFSEYLYRNFDKITKMAPHFKFLPKDMLQNLNKFLINDIDNSLTYTQNNGETLIFDKHTGLREISTFDKKTNTKTIYNLKAKTKEYIEYRDDNETVKKQIIEKYDSLVYDKRTNNYICENKISTQTISPSSIENFYNITTIDSNGKSILPTQYCNKNELGEFYVSMDSVSPSGYTTSYYYEETADNMQIMTYKITDSNGKVIMNKKQTMQPISDNKIITSINNQVYEAEFYDDILKILDKDSGKQKEFHLDFIKEGRDVVFELLKKVPANILIAIDKDLIEEISYTDRVKDNGLGGTSILIGKSSYIDDQEYTKNTLANFFSAIMIHEFGHYLHTTILDENFKFNAKNKVFESELQALFKESSSEEQNKLQHLFNYKEAFAESILSSFGNPIASEIFSHVNSKGNLRKFYFMKDFPQLIANINKIVEAQYNSEENNK